MKFLKYFIYSCLLIQITSAHELISFHIDFSQISSNDMEISTSMQTKIDIIKDLLNNPCMGAVEICGLTGISNKELKKELFLYISHAMGPLMVQNPREQNLISAIYDRKDEKQTFAHHNKAIPFHTDGAFLATVPKIIGVWVEQAAETGGETTLINALEFLHACSLTEAGTRCINILSRPWPLHVHDSYHIPNTPSYIFATPISDQCVRFRSDLLLKALNEVPASDKEDLIFAIQFFNESLCAFDQASRFLMKEDCLYFFNNFYNLHNRAPFSGERKIWRTWIGKL